MSNLQDMTETKSFQYAVWSEAVFILIACIFGGIGFWQGFAFMALLCILVPLWVGAIACVFIAATQFSAKENNDE